MDLRQEGILSYLSCWLYFRMEICKILCLRILFKEYFNKEKQKLIKMPVGIIHIQQLYYNTYKNRILCDH